MIAAILQGSVPLFINWIILGGDLQGYRNVVLIVPPGDIKNRKGCMRLVLHTCREWNYNRYVAIFVSLHPEEGTSQ